MERKIEIGHIYKHFKGHIYKVIAIAYDSENYQEKNPELSQMVVYQNVEDKKQCWVRPYQMFNSLVDKEKYPEVEQEYRFDDITKEYKVSMTESENIDSLNKLSWQEFEESPLQKDAFEDLSEFDPIGKLDKELSNTPYAGLVSNWDNCHNSGLDFTVDGKEKIKGRK